MSEQHKLRHELTDPDNIISEVLTDQRLRDPTTAAVAKHYYDENTATDDPMPINIREHPGISARDDAAAMVDETSANFDQTPTEVDEAPKSTIINDETPAISAENTTTNDNTVNKHLSINDEYSATFDENPTVNDGNTNEESLQITADSTFVPVMTVTKQEAVFTKGDLKLQKISVTEDISDNGSGGILKAVNPVYSEVRSEVIPGPQRIRGVTGASEDPHTRRESEDGTPDDKSDKEQKDKKPRTRIPRSRFKQAAEKVKKDREEARQLKKELIQPPQNIKRSAIPRLKTRENTAQESTTNRDIPPSSDTIQTTSQSNKGNLKKEVSGIPVSVKINKYFEQTPVKETNKANTIETTSDIEPNKSYLLLDSAPEDEFDKMYEDIFHTPPVEDPDIDNILDEDMEDPEKLQMSFDALINAYDENEAQTIEIKNAKSRIPLAKQKSLHNIHTNPPKQIIRRFSLKNEYFGNEKDKIALNDAMDNKDTDPKDMYNSEDAKKTEVELTNPVTTKDTIKRDLPGESAKLQKEIITETVDKVLQEKEKIVKVNIVESNITQHDEPMKTPLTNEITKINEGLPKAVSGRVPEILELTSPSEIHIYTNDKVINDITKPADEERNKELNQVFDKALNIAPNKTEQDSQGQPKVKEVELQVITSTDHKKIPSALKTAQAVDKHNDHMIAINKPCKIEENKVQTFTPNYDPTLEVDQKTNNLVKNVAIKTETKIEAELTKLIVKQEDHVQNTVVEQSPNQIHELAGSLPKDTSQNIQSIKMYEPLPRPQHESNQSVSIEKVIVVTPVFSNQPITGKNKLELVVVDSIIPIDNEQQSMSPKELTTRKVTELTQLSELLSSEVNNKLQASEEKSSQEPKLQAPNANLDIIETEQTVLQEPEVLATTINKIDKSIQEEPELLAAAVTELVSTLEPELQEPKIRDDETKADQSILQKDDQLASKVNEVTIETKHTTQQEPVQQVPLQEPETITTEVIEIKQITQEEPAQLAAEVTEDVKQIEIALPQETKFHEPEGSNDVTENDQSSQKKDDQLASSANKATIENKHTTHLEPELQVQKEKKNVNEIEKPPAQEPETIAPVVIETIQLTQDVPEQLVADVTKNVKEIGLTLPQETNIQEPETSDDVAENVRVILKKDDQLASKDNEAIIKTKHTTPQEPELQVPKENEDVIETKKTPLQKPETIAPVVIETTQITQEEPGQLAAEITENVKEIELALPQETNIQEPEASDDVAGNDQSTLKKNNQLASTENGAIIETKHTTQQEPLLQENKNVIETEKTPPQEPETIAPVAIETTQITQEESRHLIADITENVKEIELALPQETKFQEPESSHGVTKNDQSLQNKNDKLDDIFEIKHTKQQLPASKQNEYVIDTEETHLQESETAASKVIETEEATQEEPGLLGAAVTKEIKETEIASPLEIELKQPEVCADATNTYQTTHIKDDILAPKVKHDIIETDPTLPRDNEQLAPKISNDIIEDKDTPLQEYEGQAPKSNDITETEQTSHVMLTPKVSDDISAIEQTISIILPQESELSAAKANEDENKTNETTQLKNVQLPLTVSDDLVGTEQTLPRKQNLIAPNIRDDLTPIEQILQCHGLPAAPKVTEDVNLNDNTLPHEYEVLTPNVEQSNIIKTEETSLQGQNPQAPKTEISEENDTHHKEITKHPINKKLDDTYTLEINQTEQDDNKLQPNSSTTSIPDSSRMVQNILMRITSRTDIENNHNHKNTSELGKELSNKEHTDIQAEGIKEHQITTPPTVGENTSDITKVEAPVEKPMREETVVSANTVDMIDNQISSTQRNHEKPNNHEPVETPKILSVKSRIALFSRDKNVDHIQKVEDEPSKPTTNLKHNEKDHEDVMQRNKHTQLKIVKEPHESINKETVENLNENPMPASKNRNLNHEIKKQENEPYTLDSVVRKQEVHHDIRPYDIMPALKPTENVSENTLNEVLEKEINDKTTNKEDFNDGISGDEITVLKGKVSRIIGRLTSHDENKEVLNKEMIEEELPVKKSVSARIAMFERQGSKEPTAKTVKSNYKMERRDAFDQKPKIVDHVLKTQPDGETTANKQNCTFTNNLNKVEESESDNNEKVFEENVTKEMKTGDKIFIDITIQNIKGEQTDYIIKPAHTNKTNETQFRTKENNQNQFPERNKVIPNTRNEVPNVVYRESRLRTRTRDVTKRRSRSTAEIDLGDAVIGKVQDMIFRINSIDNLDEVKDKREIIRVTERPIRVKEKPRSRSVSEKIALFEKKIVPAKMADTMTVEAIVDTEPKAPINIAKTVSNEIETQKPTDEKYTLRIADLEKAKNTYGSMKNMMYIRLNDECDMPVLAVGTALLDPQLIKHVIGAAIDLGYRAIDTAYIYGNEQAVGEAIRAKIEDGTVIREDLFITNKLWSTNHRQDLVERACRASLAAMGLDYFDLYLVHNPMSFKEGADPIPKIAKVLQYSDFDYMDAWYGMEGLVNKGLVRSIGVSNFNAAQITRVYEKARVKPVINQVECHPYLTQQRLAQVCNDRGIKLSCFGVLGSKGTPAELRGSLTPVIEDPMVVVMAAGMGITPAQLLVRYQIQSGHGTVVKSSSAAHLWDNLRALTFNIDPIAMDALSALNRNKRTYTFAGMGDTHRNYPFKDLF